MNFFALYFGFKYTVMLDIGHGGTDEGRGAAANLSTCGVDQPLAKS